jgi:beta-aspartyl-dipeptidase (metallo-type)
MKTTEPVIILKNGEIFSPQRLGKKDILIGGGKILAINDDFSDLERKIKCKSIDAEGKSIIPGLVDLHEHLIGGGGEDGPVSRSPEGKASELIESGITTVVGVLGTDTISRSLTDLLFKVKALNLEGITALMYTGGYRYPSPTITGDVMKDISLINEIIGVKLAISDHRGSFPNLGEVAKLAGEVRVAGLLAKKPGIVHLHVGSFKDKLDLLWDLIENYPISISQFLPTHMARNEELIEEGKKFIMKGGNIDFTDEQSDALLLSTLDSWIKDPSLSSHVSISSDAYGSFPKFDSDGKVIEYNFGKPFSLLEMLKKLVVYKKLPLDDILPMFTSNPAKRLGLDNKGTLEVGFDADILTLSESNELEYVIAQGKIKKLSL